MTDPEQQLRSDYELFEQKRRTWFRTHPGQYVVVGAGTVAGFHKDYESALKAALESFGFNSVFLIKQVCAEEPVFVIY
jgi:hypothetical protein